MTAKLDIFGGQIVVVEMPGNLAQPARDGRCRLPPGDTSIVAKARRAIRQGEKGLVDDLEPDIRPLPLERK